MTDDTKLTITPYPGWTVRYGKDGYIYQELCPGTANTWPYAGLCPADPEDHKPIYQKLNFGPDLP